MKLVSLNISIKIDNNEQVASFLKSGEFDFILLQEAMNAIDNTCYNMFKSDNFIKEKLNFPYGYFAPIFEAKCITKNGEVVRDFNGLAQQGCSLLSKYSIVKKQNLFYYNDYKFSYDATEFREKDWARSIQKCIIEVENKKLQIINVHGIWNKDKLGDERTIKQSEFILNHIDSNMPCIVVGDFNLNPNSESIKLLNKKLKNLCVEYDIKTTRPEFDDSLDKGNSVVDYIFVNDKIKINDFRVLNKKISDHLPLILDFKIVK